jgi:hypothetical protein
MIVREGSAVSRQRLSLHGSRRTREDVRTLLIERCRTGRATLAETLAIDSTMMKALRAQGYALYRAGKWQRCADVVLGLVALGDLEPWDPVILSRCFDELGDPDRAAICAKVAEVILAELDDSIREIIGERQS